MADRPSYDSADKGKPDLQRREFLKRVGLLGGGLAGMSILAACGGGGGTPPGAPAAGGAPPGAGGATPAAAGAAQTLKATKPAQGSGSGKPIIFRGWNYHPEVVVDNVRIFNEQYGENVDYQTISGDYIPLIDKIHINKEALNLGYSVNSSLHKWYKSGWVWDLEGHWNIDTFKKELYPNWREMATTRDGKLIGLPYFQSVRGTICTNEDMLAKAGITEKEWPKTWTELYDQCYQIKKMGITDVPLLPQWYGTFLIRAWGYQAEIENRGGKLFDDLGHPVFDDMSYQVLDNARKLVSDGIVPKEMFTFQETDFVDAFSSGRYAYSAQQIYDNKVHNDPEKSKIARPHTKGGSRIVPVDKQPWGFIESGFYTVIKRADQTPDEVARAFRLAEFLGYKDKEGQFFVSKRWAIEQALNSGYPTTLQDKDVQTAYASWMPDPPGMLKAMDSLFAVARGFAVQKRAFYDEWNQKATPSLAEAMLGEKPVKSTVDELKTLAEQLLEKNKRNDPD
jgi:multiple sugar transport system substrate-binding protein